MRGGAEVARWAHNPKVIGSSPIPATERKGIRNDAFFYLKVQHRYNILIYLFDFIYYLYFYHHGSHLFTRRSILFINRAGREAQNVEDKKKPVLLRLWESENT